MFVLADDWDDDLANSARPYIELYYKQEAREFASRVGADADYWSVVNPRLKDAIDKAVLKFAESTNATTSMELSEAIERLRDELRDGLIAGEPVRELTQRVQEVFDRAEQTRAMTIATTETSRAVHEAQVLSGEASGVVVGWRWLLSEDACEICLDIASSTPVIPLGGMFAVVGTDPDYSSVRFPPAHPHCMCGVTEILDTDEDAALVTGGNGGSKSGSTVATVPVEVGA